MKHLKHNFRSLLCIVLAALTLTSLAPAAAAKGTMEDLLNSGYKLNPGGRYTFTAADDDESDDELDEDELDSGLSFAGASASFGVVGVKNLADSDDELDGGLLSGGLTASGLEDNDDDLSGGLSSGGATASLEAVGVRNGAILADGIYFFSTYGDIYMALNIQYRRTSGGAVLDSLNFEDNELWRLENTDNGYFTLSPLFASGYYLAGQLNDTQLRLSTTSRSNFNVQWKAIPDGDHYIIVNRKSGLAVDTAHGRTDTANPVLNYIQNGYREAQSWSIVRVSESTSRISSGTRVDPADGEYGLLSSGDASKCVNDQFASTSGNGTAKICLDTWNQEGNERWILTNRGNHQYTIAPSVNPNICINVWAANPKAGNQLTLATWQPGDQCSLWEIYQDGNCYSFRNVKTGLWLNLWGNTHVDGTQIVGYYYDGSAAMKWKLEPVSGSNNASDPTIASGGLVAANQNNVNYIKQKSSTCKATSAAMAVNLILGRNTYSTQSMIAYGVMCKNMNGFTYRGSDGANYRTIYKTDSYKGSLSEVTSAVETAVANGLPIVVAVHKSGGTKHHWILLVGKDSAGQYLVVDPGRGGSGSIANNVRTMSSLGYSFGLTDYSTTHYGYISFTKA